MIKIDQVAGSVPSDTCANAGDEEGAIVTTTTSAPEAGPGGEPEQVAAEGARRRLVEAIFDNLSFWTVLAASIAFLYLIWATLDVLSKYVGGIPEVSP